MRDTVTRTAVLTIRGRDGRLTERREVALDEALAARYELGEVLGTGSMSTVYRARDRSSSNDVAFKLLLPAASDAHTRAFAAEARILRQVEHENVLRVRDAGVVDGCAWIVTDIAAGGTLEALLAAKGKLPESEALRVALDLLSGLRVAHGEGIVHRDVKPANVLFTAAGRALLGDFGIARQYGDEDPWDSEVGYLFGTPLYMSPEQLALEPAAVASDLWAVGVLLYEMLAGQVPFPGDTFKDVQEAQKRPPVALDCSDETREAVEGALKPLADRWQLATGFAAALGRILDAREPQILDWVGNAYRPSILPGRAGRVRMGPALPVETASDVEVGMLERLLAATGAQYGYYYVVTGNGSLVRPVMGLKRGDPGFADSDRRAQEELVLHAVSLGWPYLCESLPFDPDGNLMSRRVSMPSESSTLVLPVRVAGMVAAVYTVSARLGERGLTREAMERATACLGV